MLKSLIRTIPRALWIALAALLAVPTLVWAAEEDGQGGIFGLIDNLFANYLVPVLERFLFFRIGGQYGIEFIVLWLIIGAVFMTLRMGFINLRGFRHAIEIVKGKYDDPDDVGEVTHFQALTTAVSGTVGIGNVAGVAIAIQLGGPGAIFWLTIAGILGMTTKFVECTLGVKYRVVHPDGTISGGPMYYLTRGLSRRGLGGLGKGLALIFAVFCAGSTVIAASIFQTNQSYAALANVFPISPVFYGIVVAALVALVIFGGVKRIGMVTSSLVPAMAVIYILACLWIILSNITSVPSAFGTIITTAFKPQAAIAGGFLAVFAIGLRRSAYSNEAGIGTAAIAHSAAKTNEPIREGIVALLEPFIDTVVICNMTALVIVLTGEYLNARDGIDGVRMTADAFGSVISWFPTLLAIAVFLFAFSTMISTAYYGEIAVSYVFGQRSKIVAKIIFILGVTIGASISTGAALDFTDMLLLAMAFPNLIGCYIMAGEVANDLKTYMNRLKSGEMDEELAAKAAKVSLVE